MGRVYSAVYTPVYTLVYSENGAGLHMVYTKDRAGLHSGLHSKFTVKV
jgi:hypothetical protein